MKNFLLHILIVLVAHFFVSWIILKVSMGNVEKKNIVFKTAIIFFSYIYYTHRRKKSYSKFICIKFANYILNTLFCDSLQKHQLFF